MLASNSPSTNHCLNIPLVEFPLANPCFPLRLLSIHEPGSLALSGDGDGGAEEAGDVLHRSQPQAGVRAAGASVQGHARPPLGGHGGRLAEVHHWAPVPEQVADAPHSVRVAVEEPLHVPAHGVQLLVADPAVVATMPGVQTQVVPTALRSRASAGYQQGFRYIL